MSEPNEPLEENVYLLFHLKPVPRNLMIRFMCLSLREILSTILGLMEFFLLSHLSGQTIQSYAGETATFLLFSWPEYLVRFN